MNRANPFGIPVVGFDPSLRNWGVAKGLFIPHEQRIVIHFLDVIRPEISEGKKISQNVKDLEAAEILAAVSWKAMEGAQAVFAEVPHGSQSSRAMVSYGVCIGVLGSLRTSGVPIHKVSEGDVKRATTGNTKATKEETIAWAMDMHPEAPWPMQGKTGAKSVVVSRAEHMADAIGAIHAGIKSSSFTQTLQQLLAVA